MEISNRVILITGGARGLGAGMARDLAARGARLALCDVDADGLEATAAELGALAVPLNVTDENAVIAAFDAVEEKLGTPEVLVNNAGITRDGLLVKVRDGEIVDRMSLAQWQLVQDVNLTGVFLCGREAATRLIRAGKPGVIINISSISKDGNFGQTNYTATKAGVAAMAVTWAKELARYGIRAASISPGFTNTEMVAAMPEKAKDAIRAQVPAKRLGEPDEIAAAARFIIENDYFSGRDVAVDGALRL
ncbi:MAG: SDR family oxidoreductase [Pseudomonadota bacterium]